MGIFSRKPKNTAEKPDKIKKSDLQIDDYAVGPFSFNVQQVANIKKVNSDKVMSLFEKKLLQEDNKEYVQSLLDNPDLEPVVYDSFFASFAVEPKRDGVLRQSIIEEVTLAVKNTMLDFGNNMRIFPKDLLIKYIQRQLHFCSVKSIDNASYHKAFSTKQDGKLSQLSLIIGDFYKLPEKYEKPQNTNGGTQPGEEG